jgi:hypothetical protein
MAITKVRDIAELGPPVRRRSAEDGLRAALDLVHVCYRFKAWPIPRGVRRIPAPSETTERAQP